MTAIWREIESPGLKVGREYFTSSGDTGKPKKVFCGYGKAETLVLPPFSGCLASLKKCEKLLREAFSGRRKAGALASPPLEPTTKHQSPSHD
jgi:hypothetical protein